MSVFYFKPRDCWAVAWQENGKRHRKYFKIEKDARDYEEERIAPKISIDQRLTVGELTAAYYRSNNIHPRTKKNVVYFLSGHENKRGVHHEGAGEFLFDRVVESLTRRDLEAMRESIRVRGAGNRTINLYQTYLRAIFSWGVDQSLVAINPWRDYKRLSCENRQCTATLDDFKRIIAVSPDWFQWSLATCYALCLRFGIVELFNLQWSAFLWRAGCVSVKQGKTGRIKQVVPPAAYMDAAHKRFSQDSAVGIPWVCHKENGERVTDYRSPWKIALREAGLTGVDIRPYDLRHVAASEMLYAGADLAAVSAQLGHSNVATTGTFYAHAISGAQKRAAGMLPELPFSPK